MIQDHMPDTVLEALNKVCRHSIVIPKNNQSKQDQNNGHVVINCSNNGNNYNNNSNYNNNINRSLSLSDNNIISSSNNAPISVINLPNIDHNNMAAAGVDNPALSIENDIVVQERI